MFKFEVILLSLEAFILIEALLNTYELQFSDVFVELKDLDVLSIEYPELSVIFNRLEDVLYREIFWGISFHPAEGDNM